MKIETLTTATAIQGKVAANNAENVRLQGLFDNLTDDNAIATAAQITPAANNAPSADQAQS